VKSEKTGKLEEKPAYVDTALDIGHKIQITNPADPEAPKYVTSLQRQMWTCTWKPEKETRRLKESDSIQKRCNYAWNLNLDFPQLAAYIKEREEEKKRIKEANEAMQERIANAIEEEAKK
jgi:hypothetical protein